MYSTHTRLSNEADSFLFDLDEQCKQSTVFDNNIFADWLTDDHATHAMSPVHPISIPFHPSIMPPSPSVASSSSLGSPQSTSLSTSPPTYNALQHEFFDAPQYSGSTDDVSSYDNQFLAAYPHGYLQPPVWAASLWDNSTTGPMITGEQFPVQTAANMAIDPAFVHSRESSPNDVFDSPPSPLFINPHNFSTSPTLAAAETIAPPTVSATRPQPYPIGRRRPQADHTAFLSTSAPSAITPLTYHRSARLSRSYTRRAQSVASDESTGDHDATIRRLPKRSQQSQDESRSTPDKSSNEASSSPQKSMLRPPKLAPSAWQLYFTDFIQKAQASTTKKLNVAQAAKEAGQEYANLSAAEKEKYKRMSQAAKDAREKELAAYMRTLTPEDIKRENAFRTAQRKAGKSRKANMKDPNAPKKPLSAYFMFLQRIRSDPELVKEVFGDETETTKQSVLAAAKWRSMTDDERKPFLAQAEQDKLDYEAARKLYENGSIAYESSIDFGTSPFVSCLGTSSSLSPERGGMHLGYVSSHVKSENGGGEGEGFS